MLFSPGTRDPRSPEGQINRDGPPYPKFDATMPYNLKRNSVEIFRCANACKKMR